MSVNGSRRVRVMMLVDHLGPLSGGGERFAVGLAAHLPRDRFQAAVCASRTIEEPWRSKLADAGVPALELGRTGSADVLPFRRLGAVLRGQRVDVLHAHMYANNWWGTLIGRSAGVPVVVAHETTWTFEGEPLRLALNGVVGRMADAFVAVSSRDRERMIALERIPPEKIPVKLNGFVPRAREGSPAAVRAELGIPADAPVVGTMSIMRPQKALHVLVEAFARVLEREPRAHLVLAGDGECREEVERRAAELGVTERVHLPGLREDVDAVLGAFDLAAMSSDYEGTPLFVFECMAIGTPLVSTDVGGVRDLLDPGRSVVLVPPRDPDALGTAIADLLADPSRRRAMADLARERARRYEMDAVASEFGDMYVNLLEGRGPGA